MTNPETGSPACHDHGAESVCPRCRPDLFAPPAPGLVVVERRVLEPFLVALKSRRQHPSLTNLGEILSRLRVEDFRALAQALAQSADTEEERG